MRHILVLLLVLALGGCAGNDGAGQPLEKDQLVRLSDSEIRGLDPQKYSDLASLRIAADQFEGLVRFDADGRAVPGLAESWTVSADGLAWTFRVRDSLRFSDGAAIDARLFERLWKRLNDPETASPHVPLFAVIDSVAASGDGQLVVTLSSPFPQLPELMAHPAMAALPMHIIDQRGDGWTAVRPLVTSGAYRLARWRLNDRLELERNPRWHGGEAPVARIMWRPVDDSLAAMRLFLAGAADIAGDYPQTRHDWLKRERPDAVRNGDYLGSYYFAFNTRQSPFDDVRVRRALAMAVDRQWIADTLLPMGNAPAWGVVPPALYDGQGSRPGWAAWPRKNQLREARRLLVQAGYHAGHKLRFEIRINSSAEHRRMAVAMAAMWRPLGVEAQILNSESSLHFAAMRRGEFALARSGWIADLPAAENFLAVHRSDAGAINYSGYASPAYDAALDRAGREADPERRQALFRTAEMMLIEDAPVIPLYYYRTGSLVGPRVAGWRDNAGNIHPSATLSLRRDQQAGNGARPTS
ncbi:MAG: peptide ABC transporter substrate-binding protein [Blastomonas sp.]